MKRFFALVLITLFISNALLAQRLMTKVPKDAAFVGVLKGKKILEEVSLEQLQQYHFGKDFFNKEIKSGKFMTAIDLTENIYYFISLTDSVSYNCVLLPIKSEEAFSNAMHSEWKKIEKKDGYSLMKSYNELTIWNNNTALIVFPFGTHEPSLYDHSYQEFYDDNEPVWTDAATGEIKEDEEIDEEVVEEIDEEIDEEVVEEVDERLLVAPRVEDVIEGPKDAIGESMPDEMGQTMEEAVEVKEEAKEDIEEVVLEEMEEDVEVVEYQIEREPESNEEKTRRIRRARAEKRWRADFKKREKEYEQKFDALFLKFASSVLTNQNKANSIATNAMYLKSINKKAAASFWTNSYGSLYMKLMGDLQDLSRVMHWGAPSYNGVMSRLSSPEANGVKELTGNIFLNKDNAEIEVNTILTDEMSKHYKSIGKRKFNKNFFKYFDSENVMGYMGFAFNTENAIEAYPEIVKSMVKAAMPAYSDEAIVASDFMSILLDAEEIGELINGDALFVISDVVDKELTYTTYEYDEDFNSTKVEKTKIEPMPEFIFMASTDRIDFFNRLFTLGVKYKSMVTEGNKIFKLADKNIPMEVYFVLHDNIFFVTSSEYQARDIAAGKKGSTTRKAKKFARKNSTIFYAKNDKILSAFPEGSFPKSMIPPIDFFHSNFDTAELSVSKIKRNRLKSNFKINTTGKSPNALKAFFELLDQVYIAK